MPVLIEEELDKKKKNALKSVDLLSPDIYNPSVKKPALYDPLVDEELTKPVVQVEDPTSKSAFKNTRNFERNLAELQANSFLTKLENQNPETKDKVQKVKNVVNSGVYDTYTKFSDEQYFEEAQAAFESYSKNPDKALETAKYQDIFTKEGFDLVSNIFEIPVQEIKKKSKEEQQTLLDQAIAVRNIKADQFLLEATKEYNAKDPELKQFVESYKPQRGLVKVNNDDNIEYSVVELDNISEQIKFLSNEEKRLSAKLKVEQEKDKFGKNNNQKALSSGQFGNSKIVYQPTTNKLESELDDTKNELKALQNLYSKFYEKDGKYNPEISLKRDNNFVKQTIQALIANSVNITKGFTSTTPIGLGINAAVLGAEKATNFNIQESLTGEDSYLGDTILESYYQTKLLKEQGSKLKDVSKKKYTDQDVENLNSSIKQVAIANKQEIPKLDKPKTELQFVDPSADRTVDYEDKWRDYVSEGLSTGVEYLAGFGVAKKLTSGMQTFLMGKVTPAYIRSSASLAANKTLQNSINTVGDNVDKLNKFIPKMYTKLANKSTEKVADEIVANADEAMKFTKAQERIFNTMHKGTSALFDGVVNYSIAGALYAAQNNELKDYSVSTEMIGGTTEEIVGNIVNYALRMTPLKTNYATKVVKNILEEYVQEIVGDQARSLYSTGEFQDINSIAYLAAIAPLTLTHNVFSLDNKKKKFIAEETKNLLDGKAVKFDYVYNPETKKVDIVSSKYNEQTFNREEAQKIALERYNEINEAFRIASLIEQSTISKNNENLGVKVNGSQYKETEKVVDVFKDLLSVNKDKLYSSLYEGYKTNEVSKNLDDNAINANIDNDTVLLKKALSIVSKGKTVSSKQEALNLISDTYANDETRKKLVTDLFLANIKPAEQAMFEYQQKLEQAKKEKNKTDKSTQTDISKPSGKNTEISSLEGQDKKIEGKLLPIVDQPIKIEPKPNLEANQNSGTQQPTEAKEAELESLNSQTTSQKTPSTQSIEQQKADVAKLFEENPESANAVYEGLGFKSKPDVILPIGTSGSGKSTFIKSLPQDNLVIIEPDAMRVEFTGDINNKSKDKEIYIEAAQRAIKAIKQGKQVVFDTTNLTKDKRLPFIEAIKKEIPTANIQYKLMELNPELAKQRIKAQLARGENRAAVSDETIDRHAASYEQMLEEIKNEPISNYEVTPQQKQQAQQVYSQYLDTVEKGSKQDIEGFKKFVSENKVILEQSSQAFSFEPTDLKIDNNFEEFPQEDFSLEQLPVEINQEIKDFEYIQNTSATSADVEKAVQNVNIEDSELKTKVLSVFDAEIERKRQSISQLENAMSLETKSDLQKLTDFAKNKDITFEDSEKFFKDNSTDFSEYIQLKIELNELEQQKEKIVKIADLKSADLDNLVESSDFEEQNVFNLDQFKTIYGLTKATKIANLENVEVKQIRNDLYKLAISSKTAKEFKEKVAALKSPIYVSHKNLDDTQYYEKLWHILNKNSKIDFIGATIFNVKEGKTKNTNVNLIPHKSIAGESFFKNAKDKSRSFFYKNTVSLQRLLKDNFKPYVFDAILTNNKGIFNNVPVWYGKQVDSATNSTLIQNQNIYIASIENNKTDLNSFADKGTRLFVDFIDQHLFKTLPEAEKTVTKMFESIGKDSKQEIAYLKQYVDSLYNNKDATIKISQDEFYRKALNEMYTWHKAMDTMLGNWNGFYKDYINFNKRLGLMGASVVKLDSSVILNDDGTPKTKMKILVVDDKNISVLNSKGENVNIKTTDSGMYMTAKKFNDIFSKGTHNLVTSFPAKPLIFAKDFYAKLGTYALPDNFKLVNSEGVEITEDFDAIVFKSAIKRDDANIKPVDVKDVENGNIDIKNSIKEIDFNDVGIQEENKGSSYGYSPMHTQYLSMFSSETRVAENLLNEAAKIELEEFFKLYSDPKLLADLFYKDSSEEESISLQLSKQFPNLFYHRGAKEFTETLMYSKLRQTVLKRSTPGEILMTQPTWLYDKYTDANGIEQSLDDEVSYLRKDGQITKMAAVVVPAHVGKPGDVVVITRIPTDKAGSTIVAQVVANNTKTQGNTIILPSKYMLSSGIDFDADSVFVWRSSEKEAYRNKEIVKAQAKSDVEAKAIDEMFKKDFSKFLNKKQQLQELAFNATVQEFLQKDIEEITDDTGSKDIGDLFGVDVEKHKQELPKFQYFGNPLARHFNTYVVNTVKKAIGTTAKAMKSLQMLQDTGFQTLNPITVDGVQYSKLQNTFEIRKLLSALMSAAVDAVKEPYNLTAIGYNDYTAAFFTTGIKLGIPAKTLVKIVKDPVVDRYLKLQRNLVNGKNLTDETQAVYLELDKIARDLKIPVFQKVSGNVVPVKVDTVVGPANDNLKAFIEITNIAKAVKPFTDLTKLASDKVDSEAENYTTVQLNEFLSNFLEFNDNIAEKNPIPIKNKIQKREYVFNSSFASDRSLLTVPTIDLMVNIISEIPVQYQHLDPKTEYLYSEQSISDLLNVSEVNKGYYTSLEEIFNDKEVIDLANKFFTLRKFAFPKGSKNSYNQAVEILNKSFNKELASASEKVKFGVSVALLAKTNQMSVKVVKDKPVYDNLNDYRFLELFKILPSNVIYNYLNTYERNYFQDDRCK